MNFAPVTDTKDPPAPDHTGYVRGNDDLGTPAWILDRVRMLGPITFDPCSNPWSLVGATIEVSRHRGEDGLFKPWVDYDPRVLTGLTFVNPPYSDPLPWAERIVEAAEDGCEIVALVKLDPSTKWSRILRAKRNARCDFHKRIKFEGGKFNSGALASSVSYFGPKPWLFAHVFSDLGEVQVYHQPELAPDWTPVVPSLQPVDEADQLLKELQVRIDALRLVNERLRVLKQKGRV